MKKLLTMLAAIVMVAAFAAPAGAQDTVTGTVEADPATVPAAGEHTLTANGSGFIPDTTILLGACTSPADTLVPGVSSVDEITEAALAIDALVDCDLATALNIEVDGDGNFSAEWTGEVGDNFFFSGGALDGSQAGAVWVPIVDPAAAELAVTGAESWMIALFGVALLAVGALSLRGARRMDIA